MGSPNVFRYYENGDKPSKKDDKKSDFGKVFTETLGLLWAGVVFVLTLIGASVVLQALCRCR